MYIRVGDTYVSLSVDMYPRVEDMCPWIKGFTVYPWSYGYIIHILYLGDMYPNISSLAFFLYLVYSVSLISWKVCSKTAVERGIFEHIFIFIFFYIWLIVLIPIWSAGFNPFPPLLKVTGCIYTCIHTLIVISFVIFVCYILYVK